MAGTNSLFPMPKAQYGDRYDADFLTLYQDYVKSTEAISEKRNRANQFFSALNTGLLAATGFMAGDMSSQNWPVALVGLLLCFIWERTIIVYRNMNSAKFDVVLEMEQHLPAAPYAKEWDYLQALKAEGKLTTFTKVEAWVPWLFGAAYIGIYLSIVLLPWALTLFDQGTLTLFGEGLG